MTIRKKVIIILLVLFVGGGIYGFYLFNKKVTGLESVKTEVKITANELYDNYEENELKAGEKYDNKVIEVSGKVASVKNEGKQNNLILTAENALMGGVNCSFAMPIQGVEKGQEIVVKGRCQGFLMDVILNNCHVVKE